MLQQQRYRKGGDPIYVRVSIPRPPPTCQPLCFLTSLPLPAPHLKVVLQGCCNLQGYLALGKLLPTENRRKPYRLEEGGPLWAPLRKDERGREETQEAERDERLLLDYCNQPSCETQPKNPSRTQADVC